MTWPTTGIAAEAGAEDEAAADAPDAAADDDEREAVTEPTETDEAEVTTLTEDADAEPAADESVGETYALWPVCAKGQHIPLVRSGANTHRSATGAAGWPTESRCISG